MTAQCSAKNDKGFQCLLWENHDDDHDWDTPTNPTLTLEHRITVQDFVNKGYSAEISVYGPDSVVYVTYYASKVVIEEDNAPRSLYYIVDTIVEGVGQS